jgi:hypothetical protein
MAAEAQVDGDPRQPRVERRRVAQLIKASPSQHIRVLHDILRVIGPYQRGRDPKEPFASQLEASVEVDARFGLIGHRGRLDDVHDARRLEQTAPSLRSRCLSDARLPADVAGDFG